MATEHDVPPAQTGNGPVPTGWARWSELFVAAGIFIGGLVILLESRDIRVTVGTTVSPRLVPEIVGIGAMAIAVWYIVDIFRAPHSLSAGEDSEDVDIDAPTSWRTLVIIGIALTLFAFTVRSWGFALASAMMFTISAYGMGSNRHAWNVAIGLTLGFIVFFVFDSWLGVRLPEGILGDLLP
jgi:putative tricarboxylic transport membrane protein